MKIALTGDVMLGRQVDRLIISNRSVGTAQLWGDMLPVLLEADWRVINLECVISERGQECTPASKLFRFRSHPRAIQFLKEARIDCVNLANNHVLDYGPEALDECLDLLDQAGIKRAGAGRSLADALKPAFLQSPGCTAALIGLTDNEPAWEASDAPGVNYIAYDPNGLIEPYLSRIKGVIAEAKSQADITIVSAHVGPNWGEPSIGMRALAHQPIDMGVDLYWGHSNHTPQGIELYRDKFIIYAAGDFVDDYAINPINRNDLSFLFSASVNEKNMIENIIAIPSAIEHCRVRRATAREAAFLNERMRRLCQRFNAPLRIQDEVCQVRGL